jgi:hypothetical protein
LLPPRAREESSREHFSEAKRRFISPLFELTQIEIYPTRLAAVALM